MWLMPQSRKSDQTQGSWLARGLRTGYGPRGFLQINCVGCRMPRIAKSAESGDIHSHVFVTLLPKDTLENPEIPNSCQVCHRHKDEDVKKLDEELKKIQEGLDWRTQRTTSYSK
jgi:hypothetical protein